MNSLCSAALALAARGFRVFPLAPRSKVPWRGSHGLSDATTDPTTIARWWGECPAANIGLVVAGLVVVDIDPEHDGDVTMRQLVNEHGRMPATMISRTGSGGWHYFYRLPATPVRQGANVLGQGIDTRTDGRGYVVAPPSVHPSGERYRWLAFRDPAPCPDWIATMAAPLPAPIAPPLPARHDVCAVDRARRYLARMDPSVAGQRGHDRAMWAAVAMVRGFSLDSETALSLLMSDAFNLRCDPPWNERELRHKVESAEQSNKPAGFLLNVPRRAA